MSALRHRITWPLLGGLAIVLVTTAAHDAPPYPLDGYEHTGIRRLRAYRMMIEGTMPGGYRLPPGAKLPAAAIRLRLAEVDETLDIGPNTPVDSQLQRGIDRIVATRDPSYRLAVLDITDPTKPRYAATRPREGYTPGSIGKLLVATAVFHQLKKRYPDDVAARARVLRDTRIVADRWVIPNSHAVPVVADDWSGVTHRGVRVGDEFSLWEWIDHALSPSSNAAGTMAWKHAMLMEAFGARYPVSVQEQEAFFRETPKRELATLAYRVIEEPLLEMGLDTAQLKLRTFFTNTAAGIVPGQASLVTPEQLVRWMVKLEQGKVVDRWSSLEIKKLMYFTRRRYRYAASPRLDSAAVFFKSGSLFRCKPEPDYQCVQYKGNLQNLMHSVAIIESPAGGERPRVYLVAMMSDVLKLNSAQVHQDIAGRVEQLIRSLDP